MSKTLMKHCKNLSMIDTQRSGFMTNDISSNYVDITYTVDEIHAMSKLLYKVQKDSQYSELLKDEDLIEFVDKTTGNDFLW